MLTRRASQAARGWGVPVGGRAACGQVLGTQAPLIGLRVLDPSLTTPTAYLPHTPLASAGQLVTPLVGAADRSIGRNQETNAGNLVCEALTYAATTSVPAAVAVLEANPTLPIVCLENAGGIRTDIPAGNVTTSQVNGLLPFGNT